MLSIDLGRRYYPFFSNARVENAVIRGSRIRAAILVPPLSKVVFLNETAYEILKLLSRRLSLEEVVEVLAERYRASREVIKRDVVEFVSSAIREGFITEKEHGSVPVHKLEAPPPPLLRGYLSFPVDVDVEVTRKCNMKCLHCYSSASIEGRDLPIEVIEELASELAARGALRVMLGGGEPLIRSDLPDIVRLFSEKGIAVLLSTNGLLFDESIGRELYLAGLRVIQFSLDGLGGTHDRVRGVPGAFKKVTEAVKTAKELGFTVLVKTVVMRDNLAEIPRLLGFVDALRVDMYSFNRAVPSGRARENWSRVHVSYADYEKVLRSLKGLMAGCRTAVRFEERAPGGAQRLSGEPSVCNAGVTYISLDSELYLKPCSFFPRGFSCGKLYESWRTLNDAWHGCALLKVLRSLTFEELEEPCRSCRRCYGGCRAAAILTFGRLKAPDPLCPLVEGVRLAGG